MMSTKVVSFREDEEALRFVREQGLKPSEVAKKAFEEEVERMRAEWFEAIQGKYAGIGPFERERQDRF